MTLEEFLPLIDNKVNWGIKSNFQDKYSFLIENSIKSQNPITEAVIITANSDYRIINIENDSQFELEYSRKLSVIWLYSVDNYLDKDEGHLKFDFWAIGYINLTKQIFSWEVIDPFKFHLKKVQELKIKTAKELNIPTLLTYNSNYMKMDFFGKFIQICRDSKPLKQFNDFELLYDIIHISEDLSFTLSELNLFKPYLRNFLEDPIRVENKTVYTYFPSFYDKRYFHLSSIYLQLLYNYWDRIGDLLFHFFELEKKLNLRDVYFERVMSLFPKKFKDRNFNFLRKFLDKEYKKFNPQRRDIVHYNGLESEAYSKYLKNNSEKSGIIKVQKWKVNLINDFYKLHMKSLEGMERVLKMIENRNKFN